VQIGKGYLKVTAGASIFCTEWRKLNLRDNGKVAHYHRPLGGATTIDHLECFNKPTESEKEQLFDFSRALSGGDVLKLKIFN